MSGLNRVFRRWRRRCVVVSVSVNYTQEICTQGHIIRNLFRGVFSRPFRLLSFLSPPSHFLFPLFPPPRSAPQIQLRDLGSDVRFSQRRSTTFAGPRHVPWALNTPEKHSLPSQNRKRIFFMYLEPREHVWVSENVLFFIK